jgi:sterol desaturase/sphingolipid hydroxylase (fatty acid hydroxylase superfamily)
MRWLVYPVVVGGSLATTLIGLARGVEPALLLTGVTAATAALLFTLERVRPYSRAWAHTRGDVGTDLAFAGLAAVGSDLLGRLVPLAALVAVLARGPIAGLGLWPTHAPVLLQGTLALLLTELYAYWLHRWMHRVPWLWRLHAIHHSVERVYWLNALRMHPLDTLLSSAAFLIPALMGATPGALAVAAVLSSAHALLQHANTDVASGPLDWLFSTPTLHRWHHSRVLAENDGNFGGVLIVWDVLFGTRIAPARPPPEDVGLTDLPDFPRRFWPQLLAPFARAPWRASADRSIPQTVR